MKLTATQLKQIIAEEIRKTQLLNEYGLDVEYSLGSNASAETIKNAKDALVPLLDEIELNLNPEGGTDPEDMKDHLKAAMMEFINEFLSDHLGDSSSTGMQRKVDPDFHLKAALKRVPSFNDIDVNLLDVDMLEWFQDMSDEYSEDRLLKDFHRDWDIPGVTLKDIKNIQIAMEKDNEINSNTTT